MTTNQDEPAKLARMVDLQLVGRGIHDRLVLWSFRSVPRGDFVPAALAEYAYEDMPLAIEAGQTISQPYVVAVSVQALQLRGGERALEVGTGSGYAAAILSRIADQVYTIERIAELAASAEDRLRRLGYSNVHVRHGDGSLGWPEQAPFDAILVSAGAPEAPPSLLEQLAIGGRMVIPIGPDERSQVLTCITRRGASLYHHEPLADVRFVPLIGEEAFPAEGLLRNPPSPTGMQPAPTATHESAGHASDISHPSDSRFAPGCSLGRRAASRTSVDVA